MPLDQQPLRDRPQVAGVGAARAALATRATLAALASLATLATSPLSPPETIGSTAGRPDTLPSATDRTCPRSTTSNSARPASPFTLTRYPSHGEWAFSE